MKCHLTILQIITICFLLLFPAVKVFSQQVNEDSLRKIIALNRRDTSEVDALNKLGRYILNQKSEDSVGLQLLDKAYNLAISLRYYTGKTQNLISRAVYYNRISDWQKTIEIYETILSGKAPEKDSLMERKAKMMAANNLASTYNINADYSSALTYRLKSLELAEKYFPTDSNNLIINYTNIASEYRQLNLLKKAQEYIKKAEVFLPGSKPALQFDYWYEFSGISEMLKNNSDVKMSIAKMEEVVNIASLSNYQKLDLSQALYTLKGSFYRDVEKKFPEAIESHQKALDISIKMKEERYILSTKYNLAKSYFDGKQEDKSYPLLIETFESGITKKIPHNAYRSAYLLSEILEKKGNYKLAISYLRAAYKLEDSLDNDAQVSQINFMEGKYQNAKKEIEINDLKIENSLNKLSVDKRNRLLIILSILAVAGFLILSLLVRVNRQKRILAEKEKFFSKEQVKFLENQQQLVSLQSMVNGQETERTRIAKDLHDGLGGLFSTVKMHLSTLQHEQQELQTNALFIKSYELINTASEEVRSIAHNMMPEVLLKMGVVQATQELCNSISAGKLLNVSMQSYGMEKRLNSSTEIMLFRIIQELLNNIIKHANASEAILQFNRQGNRLTVTVEDNGRGFNLSETDAKISAGLSSVQSRVQYLNGQLSIDSQKEIGTTILMDFLINEEETSV